MLVTTAAPVSFLGAWRVGDAAKTPCAAADIHSSSDDSFDDPICNSRLAVDKFTAAGSGWAGGSSNYITVTSCCTSEKATAHGSAMTLKDQ